MRKTQPRSIGETHQPDSTVPLCPYPNFCHAMQRTLEHSALFRFHGDFGLNYTEEDGCTLKKMFGK